MSAIGNMWGDTIYIVADPDTVIITIVECFEFLKDSPASEEKRASIDMDAWQARKLITQLEKVLDEMEGM